METKGTRPWQDILLPCEWNEIKRKGEVYMYVCFWQSELLTRNCSNNWFCCPNYSSNLECWDTNEIWDLFISGEVTASCSW